MPDTTLLEQYKSYVGDLGNIGSRYTTTNGFYLSIVSALIAFIGFTRKEESLETLRGWIYIAVPIFAILLCLVWHLTMKFYSGLFKVKFDVLREMEQRLPFPTYETEDRLLRERKSRLISIEKWVPAILSLPFVIVLAFGLSSVKL